MLPRWEGEHTELTVELTPTWAVHATSRSVWWRRSRPSARVTSQSRRRSPRRSCRSRIFNLAVTRAQCKMWNLFIVTIKYFQNISKINSVANLWLDDVYYWQTKAMCRGTGSMTDWLTWLIAFDKNINNFSSVEIGNRESKKWHLKRGQWQKSWIHVKDWLCL